MMQKLCLPSIIGVASAYPSFLQLLPHYPPDCPAVGHQACPGGGTLSSFGNDWTENGGNWGNHLCRLDSDGDGQSNGDELGDPCCLWSQGATVPSGVFFPDDLSSPG